MTVAADQVGWMTRCVLIGSVRQADRWMAALQAAGAAQDVDVVPLTDLPSQADSGDHNRIFVALDRRHLAPAPSAERIAILDGVQLFAGLDFVPEADARVHLIEVSRYAVEALDWGAEGVVISSDLADKARSGNERLNLVGMAVTPPALEHQGESLHDQRAARSLCHLGGQETAPASLWGPQSFLYDRAPILIDDREAILDMTGPPRPLLRGPYFWAPGGRWRLKASFSVDDDAAGHKLQFRWGPPLAPTIYEVTPVNAGIYEVIIEADWATIDGMEFTVALVHGCVAGRFGFRSAVVEHVERNLA